MWSCACSLASKVALGEMVAVEALVSTIVCMVIIYSKSKDQPDKVANPARDQLDRENESFPFPVRA